MACNCCRAAQPPRQQRGARASYVPDHVRNPQKYTCYALEEPLIVGGGDQGGGGNAGADGGRTELERVRDAKAGFSAILLTEVRAGLSASWLRLLSRCACDRCAAIWREMLVALRRHSGPRRPRLRRPAVQGRRRRQQASCRHLAAASSSARTPGARQMGALRGGLEPQ